MHRWMMRSSGALLFASVLALAGCSGSDGKNGTNGIDGTNGTNGTNGINGTNGTNGVNLTATAQPESCVVCHADAGALHQATYNQYTNATTLNAVINGLTSTLNADNTTYTSVLTVTITQNGQPITDPTLLKQKTFYAVQYDPATSKFVTATAFSFPASGTSSTLTATGTPGQYTVTKANAPFAPESAANTLDTFVYGYVATGTPIVPPKGHYNLYPDVYNFGQVYRGSVAYSSTANVSACEACHGKPYRKHGYRMAVVPGLNDFVGCKACHTDQRVGTDFDWQVIADDPATYAGLPRNTSGEIDWTVEPALSVANKYLYTANVMNDTHMSHAMEFEYPQSMANCATCHAGKLDRILTDANFTLTTCKSCHPVTGTNGDPKRAPALKALVAGKAYTHSNIDFYASTANCNGCHSATGFAPTFSQIHTGYDKMIYADAAGTKYSSQTKAQVDSATFDAGTNLLTVNFSVTGTNAAAVVPSVVISLYGYDTKDFIVSGHGSQPAPDGKRNLEWTQGSTSNSPRLTVTAGATAGTWTAVADLTLWASMLADHTVKKAEIGILPGLGVNPASPPQNDATKANYNPAVALDAVTRTFDLVGNAVVADANVYGKFIVDPAKCNKCHDALATTFHSADRGGNVVGCRLCHTTLNGGSHLEMQSRSIDSYVHAIHGMQAFDFRTIDFTDPIQSLRYNLKNESTYPNFTLLNCESCHNPGMYGVPANDKSLPGILSAAAVNSTSTRTIGAFPSVVTGPGSRACGSCHRAEMINEDDANLLGAFDTHTGANGYLLDNTTPGTPSVLDKAIQTIMSFF